MVQSKKENNSNNNKRKMATKSKRHKVGNDSLSEVKRNDMKEGSGKD